MNNVKTGTLPQHQALCYFYDHGKRLFCAFLSTLLCFKVAGIVGQAINMLIYKFGIFGFPKKASLDTLSTITGVACKLHNFIIDMKNDDLVESIPLHKRQQKSWVTAKSFLNGLHKEIIQRINRRDLMDKKKEMTQEPQTYGFLHPERRYRRQ